MPSDDVGPAFPSPAVVRDTLRLADDDQALDGAVDKLLPIVAPGWGEPVPVLTPIRARCVEVDPDPTVEPDAS